MLDRDLKEREQATLLLGIFAATLGYLVPIPTLRVFAKS